MGFDKVTLLQKTPDLQGLLDAMQAARSETITAKDEAVSAKNDAVGAAIDLATLGGVGGTVSSQADLPPAADHDGEFWYVVGDTAYYKSDGTSWTLTGPDLSDASNLTKGTVPNGRLSGVDGAGDRTTPTAVQAGKVYAVDGAGDTAILDPSDSQFGSTEDAIQEALTGSDTSGTSQTSWAGADENGGGQVRVSRAVSFSAPSLTIPPSVELFRPGAQFDRGLTATHTAKRDPVRAAPVATTSTYDSEPHLAHLGGREWLLVYRSGSGHATNDGKLVQRRSTDGGRTFGSEEVVVDQANIDDRNHSLIHVPGATAGSGGRLVLFYRRYDASASATEGTFKVESTDGGASWSAPVEVSSKIPNTSVPFGGAVQTSNGLMTLFYQSGVIEALFSTDQGHTFGSVTSVADTSGDSESAVEPVPLRVTDDKIIILGRENTTGDFFYQKSSDGGATWGSPTYFSLLDNKDGTPLWAQQVHASTAVVAVGTRFAGSGSGPRQGAGSLYVSRVPLGLLWQDPSQLKYASFDRVWNGQASEDRDFGYPTVAPIGGGPSDGLIAWYDKASPDIYVSSLSADSRSTRKHARDTLEIGQSLYLVADDLSGGGYGPEENGRIYRHDGSSSISADGGTTSSAGYYVWDDSANEFKTIVQF